MSTHVSSFLFGAIFRRKNFAGAVVGNFRIFPSDGWVETINLHSWKSRAIWEKERLSNYDELKRQQVFFSSKFLTTPEKKLGGGFKYVIMFIPIWGRWTQFDEHWAYFSKGLVQPPTRKLPKNFVPPKFQTIPHLPMPQEA